MRFPFLLSLAPLPLFKDNGDRNAWGLRQFPCACGCSVLSSPFRSGKQLPFREKLQRGERFTFASFISYYRCGRCRVLSTALFFFFSMGNRKSKWCINSRRSSMRKFTICHYGGTGINLRRLPRRGGISAAAGLHPPPAQSFSLSPPPLPLRAMLPSPTRLQLGGYRIAAAFSFSRCPPFTVKAWRGNYMHIKPYSIETGMPQITQLK